MLLTSIEALPPALAAFITPEEKKYIDEIKQRGLFPFGVTPHFASLASPQQNDPIRRQFFPDPRETLQDPFALDDPLGEKLHRAHASVHPRADAHSSPRFIHQYKNRVLLLIGGGKVRLCEDIIAEGKTTEKGQVYLLRDKNGTLWEYPV